MQFDKGYLSPHFVTNQDRMECVLENPWILVHEKKISNIKDIVPMLEKIAQSSRPLLIIAEDIEAKRSPRWSSTSCAASQVLRGQGTGLR